MKRNKTSRAWMQEHVTDHFVHKAKAEGFRSRAAFKLIEINNRDRLLRPGRVVVDLGAAPGGWSQVAVEQLGEGGQVIALDLLEMVPVPGVSFIQGDFCEEEVLTTLEALLRGRQPGLVLSDMAPNISGIAATDQARSIYLAELALDFAVNHLSLDGDFLVKVFHGSGFDTFREEMQKSFRQVLVRKPEASRDRSREVYLLGRGVKQQK